MPATYPHITQYHAELERLIEFGGSDNESSIRRAFANCLNAYCGEHRERLALVDELGYRGGVFPDGTVKDSLRMARGYWEAKDSHDDLDAEIENKFNRGYPRDNIIFEDSQTAILIQNGETAMRVNMSRQSELHRLIRRFLDYELPEIEDFRRAQRQFKDDLPSVLESLRETIEDAEGHNAEYQTAAAEFLDLCHRSIGPDVSDADVREMLLQHILTKDIFLRVFAEDQFHRENNIASRLDALERTFFTGDTRRQAIDRLRAYYGAIGRAADEIADYAEKQSFLKAIYEDFYKAYNPAAADRLGVVYTPNEVVDFIIRGADFLSKRHFGRGLADDNVQILDPATGTGTFITNLIDYLARDGSPGALRRLEKKYLNEIHANEVAILPYYIANLNIEYTYKERAGEYREFPNLVFVDTLDNLDWQGATGGAVQRQGAFELGSVSFDNWYRMQAQNEKPISVILGNPPYNDSATLWGDGGANRAYPEVDQRIKDTYIKEGTAQRTHQYDMYKRFLRWASDRLDDDGIIAFITNRAYIDKQQDDGFRKITTQEFSDVYVIDLGGDVRGKNRVGNIFGIMTGVAIGFFVRNSEKQDKGKVHYLALDDAQSGAEKLGELASLEMDTAAFKDITPDSKDNWVNQSNPDFEKLTPLANRQTKFAKTNDEECAVFRLFANAVKSNRDDWVYDFDVHNLRNKALFFADTYNELLDRDDKSYPSVIKWSRDLRNEFRRERRIVYSEANRIQSLFRPFVTKHHFADFTMNDVLTRNHYSMFGADLKQPNQVICFQSTGARRPFAVLATDKVSDFHLFFDGAQCLPLYRYTEVGERVSNITDWGLRRVNERYRREYGEHFEEAVGADGITAEDVFAYTYAVLHDPVYRHDYAVDLLREFPRLPLYHDFAAWRDMGNALLDLHIGFEDVQPYPLEINIDGQDGEDGAAPRVLLRADKDKGIIRLDERTTLRGVPADAWRYMLGNRSALEWVLDQYKEKKPRDATIAAKFNAYRFADHKQAVIELLGKVCAVSVKTMDIVDSMAYWDDGYLIVFDDRDKHEWTMMGLARWFSEPNNPDDDPEYQNWLLSLPDIREQGE